MRGKLHPSWISVELAVGAPNAQFAFVCLCNLENPSYKVFVWELYICIVSH